MVSSRKSQIQVLVLGVMVFLTLSFFVSGQAQPPDPPVPGDGGENQPPQIVSIEVSSLQNIYVITIGITDGDPPEFLTVLVRHEDGTTKEAEFIESRILEGNTSILIFEVSFPLDPGSHTFTVFAEDSESRIEKEVIVAVLETSALLNLPPQILSVEFDNEQNNYTIKMKIQDEVPSQYLNVYVQLGIEPLKKAEFIESDSAFEVSFTLEEGFHIFTITAIDPHENKTELQVSLAVLGINLSPKIVSIKSDSTRNGYVITVEIEDEDPHSVNVLVKGISGVTFEKGEARPVSETMERITFTSDPIVLDPGPHPFTVTVEDSDNETTSMQTTINVPKSAPGPFLLLFVLLPVIIIFAIIFLKRNPEQKYSKKGRLTRVGEAELVYCPSCGKKNLKGVSFCRHCGTPLKPVDELEKEKFFEVLQKKLDNGEISQEEYSKTMKKLEEGL